MELSPTNFEFAGWATRSNQLCADGRTIMPDAFKHHDGTIVPLLWNHQHNDPFAVLGKALLHCIDGDVYAYCAFNDTESGNTARELVQHGDVCSLSICANQLKHNSSRGVTHGMIRELSLVIAGANPTARIESVKLAHGADGDVDDEIHVFVPDPVILNHSEVLDDVDETVETEETDALEHSDNKDEKKEDSTMSEETKKPGASEEKEETVADVFNTLSEKQKTVVYAMIGQALEDAAGDNKEDNTMKHNVFDTEDMAQGSVLTHADQMEIIKLAKDSGVGSLKKAMEIFAAQNSDTLAHGIDEIELLFPEYKDVHAGAPELLERDQSWVGLVMRKAHKSPYSRIRTRQADARANELRAKGYNDRNVAKSLSGNIKLLMRTTDPQTVYRRDELHRDDVIDITDFDVVAYQKNVMRHNLEEDIALAALIGDGREDTDPDKIHENHIRSIWNDDELYCIHCDVDMDTMRQKLQGTNTQANFGEEYIQAEAMVASKLYATEKYKGKGQLDCFIEPHALNVMLLARDLNGRRIYESKADLAKALNVGEIHTVEQFAGKTRTTEDGKTKKLLAIFVNMGNYQFGSTKGGEITNFEDFDIDFNKYKYLMETRLSGALTEVYSAIVLEEDVTDDEAAG